MKRKDAIAAVDAILREVHDGLSAAEMDLPNEAEDALDADDLRSSVDDAAGTLDEVLSTIRGRLSGAINDLEESTNTFEFTIRGTIEAGTDNEFLLESQLESAIEDLEWSGNEVDEVLEVEASVTPL